MYEALKDRSVIHVQGTDAQDFLQRITTNDIIKNNFSYNYLLNNQGRYLFDFFVFKKNQDSYYIEIDKSAAGKLIKKLSLYKLRSNLEIEDVSSQYKIIYSKETPRFDSFATNKDPRFDKLGYRTIIYGDYHDEITKKQELYLSDKYNYAIPDGLNDMLFERSIPIEYGGEELHAIDYNKGCYIGQEVISRTKHQGVVRKKIYKLTAETELAQIKHGTEITDINNNKIGTFCSGHQNIAIGIVREEKFLALKEKTGFIDKIVVQISIPSWRQ